MMITQTLTRGTNETEELAGAEDATDALEQRLHWTDSGLVLGFGLHAVSHVAPRESGLKQRLDHHLRT